MTRAPRLAALVLAIAVLPGCLTTSLWNDPGDTVYDHEDHNYELNPRVEGFGDLLIKIVATPFAFAFDLVTFPFQALLVEGDAVPLLDTIFGDDDDCD